MKNRNEVFKRVQELVWFRYSCLIRHSKVSIVSVFQIFYGKEFHMAFIRKEELEILVFVRGISSRVYIIVRVASGH